MRIIIKGVVQGVGFRPTVYRVATSLGINGRVWNNGSGVVVEVDDPKDFVEKLKRSLPPLARMDSIETEESEYTGGKGFSIAESENDSDEISIPTDTAICDECLKEMRSEGRRKDYAFTSCTNCGPRFTLIDSLPYDRKNTAMDDFPFCEECGKEFKDPKERRFHHQTICCPDCGPYYFFVRDGVEYEKDPIKKFAEQIEKGKIGIAKSWGGMHICCKPSEIEKLRKWYGREQKPFAIMVRNLDAAKKYCELTPKEEELLVSPHRPIVLAKKKDIDGRISPGLDNVGIFLPYTGMQHLLFDNLKTDSLIMTSANLPGEPMIIFDEDVMELDADCYLLHNQRIMNRADDSVVRVYKDNTQFIRKSRGFVPSFIETDSKHCVVGIGAQENLTASVASRGRIHSTQYIGNGESFGVPEYLEAATDSLINMLGCRPEMIAMDLHPGYSNRKYGKSLAKRFDVPVMEVQHHWAHAASLMAEHGLNDAVVLTLDGTGHGDDGNAWGGEVLRSSFESYKRVAHLEYIPLLGSEKALYDLRRLRFAIDHMNGEVSRFVDGNTANILSKMMPTSVKSSSMGRFLDAMAYSLNICKNRTYDGEPAMKTEPYLAKGKLIDGFETETMNGVVKTAHLFTQISKSQRREDIAYSMTYNVIKELVDRACDDAQSKGIEHIGLSGGVSYSAPICAMTEEFVKKRGMKFVTHDRVPNGDGGISVGQVAIALKKMG